MRLVWYASSQNNAVCQHPSVLFFHPVLNPLKKCKLSRDNALLDAFIVQHFQDRARQRLADPCLIQDEGLSGPGHLEREEKTVMAWNGNTSPLSKAPRNQRRSTPVPCSGRFQACASSHPAHQL